MSATIATTNAVQLSVAPTNQEQGLEFQVRECYDEDDVRSVAPAAAVNLTSDSESDEEEEEEKEPAPLMRQMSSAAPKKPVAAPAPVPAVAVPTTDSNIQRVDFKDEATTVKILTFLESRGINTNKLVQEHILKYGSRARIAVNDDGEERAFISKFFCWAFLQISSK